MNRIASVFVEIQETKIDYVLLFSHGNSTDLGYMLNTYLGFNCMIIKIWRPILTSMYLGMNTLVMAKALENVPT